MQNSKPRLQPTHFIEVWTNTIRTTQGEHPLQIANLEKSLMFTLTHYPLRTVAVFLIKPKS